MENWSGKDYIFILPGKVWVYISLKRGGVYDS